ncbi:MAG: hypothetical protein ABS75_03660 [Pelagibacterium sp. SCN 63-23]|mgnify:CR=1 FL=1|nr:MAG: hypothetical protein ABS75_03660 [Pelagibacterium sp. SCN 63-23]
MADRDNVQSVTRALLLLETLAEDGAGWRLTDLARSTGLSRSTAHRLLTTLQDRRFVQYDANRALWSIGGKAFSVGAAFGQRQALIAPALPHLRTLRDLTRETANFGVVDDGAIVVMAQVESREIVRAIARTGGRANLAFSAMGKAVLSAYSDEQVETALGVNGAVGSARHDTAGRAALNQAIATARAQGYAVDNQEGAKGLTCVASPVRNASGDVVGAISVSCLAARMSDDRLPGVGAQVARIAEQFSAELGTGAGIQSARTPGRQRSSGGPAARR